MSPPALILDRVSRRYGSRLAVAGVDLHLRAGQITCLLGPSGCGKSTLLRLIAGLEPVDEGQIEMGGTTVSAPGRHLPPEDRAVGLVFQDFALFPHLHVAENVGFGLRKMTVRARRARVDALLARFRLEQRAKSWPHTLSGGEQQRVAIARALAPGPSVLLLDEPFSGLDGHLRTAVRRSVLAELRTAEVAVLIVTHDPEEAMMMADDLALMANGRVLQVGSPEDCYRRPVSIEAARLLGEATPLPALIVDGIARTAFGDLPAPTSSNGDAIVIVRPEALRVEQDGVEAVILEARFGGAYHSVTLAAGADTLSMRWSDSHPREGDKVRVGLDPDRALIRPISAES